MLFLAVLFSEVSCERPVIEIYKPEEETYITKDGNVDVSGAIKGRSRGMKQIEFVLEDKNGEEITPCDPVIPERDRSFEANFQIDNPGKYTLTVRFVGQEDGPKRIIIYPSPPKFLVNDIQQPDGYIIKIKKGDEDKIKIEVRDEDGDLDKVTDGKREFPVIDNEVCKIAKLTPDMGDNISIIAIDKQDNIVKLNISISDYKDSKKVLDSEPVEPIEKTSPQPPQTSTIPQPPPDKTPPTFVYDGKEQQNGATIILKADEKPEIEVKDNILIAEVDGKTINSGIYKIDISTFKEGFKTIVAKDGSGNLARLNIVKDVTPPNYEVKSPVLKRAENKLFIKDGDDLKLEFKDNYRLSRITINDEETRYNVNEINISSEKLKSENKIDVYDMSNNVLTLNVVKYVQPILTIESPKNNSLTNSNQVSVVGTVKKGYGRKQIFINELSSPVSDEKFSVVMKLENEGENIANIYVKDEIGQSGTVKINIVRDTIPPKVETSDNVISIGNSIVIVEKLGQKSQEVKISDRSGIGKVLVNNRNLKFDSNKFDIPYDILSDGRENTIKIQDLAGNDIEIPTRFNKNVDTIFEQAVKCYKEKKYEEALKWLDNYEKKRPGLPTTNLYRGMIYYERKNYQKAIDYLEEAYARRSSYDGRGPNIEYNLFYWGAALYEMINAQTSTIPASREEREKQNATVSRLLNKAMDKIDQFLNFTQAKERTPNLYESAVRMRNDLSNISKSISISSPR